MSALFDRQPWVADAACRGMDPALFIIERGDDSAPAKAVCRECTVRLDCLRTAMVRDEIGVWGGFSHRERNILARRLRAAGDVRFRTITHSHLDAGGHDGFVSAGYAG